MLDIFVLEEDYFQQARLEDAIHKSKQIYILRITFPASFGVGNFLCYILVWLLYTMSPSRQTCFAPLGGFGLDCRGTLCFL